MLPLKVSLLIMGASGIVAQIVLLRELLISFLGNELTLGIILANWLILEAIGSFIVGKSVEKVKRKMEVFVSLQIFFSVALPFSIYLCRTFKNILLTTPGEGLGFIPIFYSSLLILLPVSIFHGALFTYGCKLYALYSKEEASSIGKVYVFETVGSIIGGLLITFLLIQYFNSFQIAFMVSLLNAIISVFLLWPEQAKLVHLRKGLWILSILYTFLFLYLLFTPISEKIHRSSIESQWRGLNVIHNENSIYGNITVTKRGEQFTFFTDGIPSITTPVPDIAFIENFVHFSMLLHKKPGSVLILSGGAGGMINEILKYPVARVDYVELDPLLLKLIHRFPTPLTQSELSDERVNIHYTDGRFFVNRTPDRFDLIFIGLSAPHELQTNRLFSSEFFSMARRKMNPGGIIVLTLPGSLTYISPELRDLNGCIWDTLKSVFKYVRIIPGDVNLYFASDSEKLLGVTSGEMLKRLEERKIKTNLFTKSYVEYRLHERWLNWFLKSMERKEVHINSDFRPLGVFFNLSYWNALFSPYLTKVFKWFEGLSLALIIGLTALPTLFLAILFVRRPLLSRYSLPYAIFTSGFVDMMLNLAIIFTFQTLYGYLYHQIGLLITIFMVGIALSSFFITRRLDRIKEGYLLFLGTELSIILFSIILPFILSIPSHYLEKTYVYVLLYATFLTMSFLCGALVGLQFPLATKIYMKIHLREGMIGHTAGLLYGADLLGGFFGGLLGGILLFPILGLKDSCFIMAIIKTSSLTLLLIFMKIHKSK
ncbi:MAG: fused MFS/spermidine synthase [Thermodesulfobacteriota bacterium]|nr:fused MFS/spermidine synthase [Thermodesulfobacteriota bacterium]